MSNLKPLKLTKPNRNASPKVLAEYYHEKGKEYRRADNKEMAKYCFQNAVWADIGHSASWYRLGQIAQEAGMSMQAYACYVTALEGGDDCDCALKNVIKFRIGEVNSLIERCKIDEAKYEKQRQIDG